MTFRPSQPHSRSKARRAGNGTPMSLKAKLSIAAAVGLLASVVLANYATSTYGMIPVGFGFTSTAGTFLAGVTFVLRDALQDAAGKRVTIAVIAAAAILSFAISDPFIALASAVAFLLAELADLAVYTPLRKRGYIRAAVASNIVGSFVDTVVFLAIAGFAILPALPGQMVAKMAVTAAVVAIVATVRAIRRSPAHAVSG